MQRYKKHPKTEIPKTTPIHRHQMNARWNAFVSSSDGSPKNMDGPCELVRSTVSCHGLGISCNLIRLKEWYDIRRFWQMLFFPFFFQVQFVFHLILRFLRYESPEFLPLRSGWWVGTSASKVVSIFPEILVEQGVGHEVGSDWRRMLDSNEFSGAAPKW